MTERWCIFSGTNTWAECRTALAALAGAGDLLDGPDIARYEAAFAAAAGCARAFSFASGRMALYRLLEALDVGPGDEVLLPAFTCVVVANAVLYRGARPVYADIGPDFNIDPEDAARKAGPRTKVVVAQHTFGRVCDVAALAELCRARGASLIEDCAHALGAARDGRPAGSLACAAYFSTDHSKVVSTGTGGAVTTSDPALAARLGALHAATPFLSPRRVRRILATFAAEFALTEPSFYPLGRFAFKALGRAGAWGYFRDELLLERPTAYPYPARLSAAQARIGLSQLERLARNIAHRRAAAAAFARALGPAAAPPGPGDACLRFTWLAQDRAPWLAGFRDLLDMGVWFTSVVEGRSERLEDVGYRPGSCPRAEFAAAHCLNLPTHERVSSPDLLAERLRALAARLPTAAFPDRRRTEERT